MISPMSSSARKHRDSGNTVAVQAGVQYGQDGRRRQGADKRDAGGTEQSVSAKCQVSDDCVGNLCGSRVTCRDKITPTSVHLNDHTLQVRQRFRVEIEGRQAGEQARAQSACVIATGRVAT